MKIVKTEQKPRGRYLTVEFSNGIIRKFFQYNEGDYENNNTPEAYQTEIDRLEQHNNECEDKIKLLEIEQKKRGRYLTYKFFDGSTKQFYQYNEGDFEDNETPETHSRYLWRKQSNIVIRPNLDFLKRTNCVPKPTWREPIEVDGWDYREN